MDEINLPIICVNFIKKISNKGDRRKQGVVFVRVGTNLR